VKEMMDNLVKKANRENVRIIEMVCTNFDMVVLQQQNENNLDKYYVDLTAKIRKSAKNLYIELLQNPSVSEKTIGEFLDEKLSSLSEIERNGVKQHFILINHGFEQAKTKNQINKELFNLVKVFRGLLYVGIFETEGEKLDKKIFADNFNNIKNEIVGLILPLGLLKALWKAFIEYYSYDFSNKSIDNAIFLEKYLASYLLLLQAWSDLITEFKQTIENMNDN
jgi:hypothetical protein